MLNVSNNRVWKWYRRHHRVVGVLLEIAAEAIPGGKLVVTALQMAAAAVEDKVDAEILALLEAVQPVVSGLVDEIEHAPNYQPDMSAEALRRTVIQGEIAQELAPLLPQLSQSISRSVANRSGGKVVLDGRYELGNKLGEGGQGEVYQARHLQANTAVAIKLLPPVFSRDVLAVEGLRLEYQNLVLKLRHPHIVAYTDFGRDAGMDRYYLVMDYIEGQTLRGLMLARSNQPMPLADCLNYLLPVAQALDFTHAQGIAHQDIKPENILIRQRDNQVFVVDFGLSRSIRHTLSIKGKASEDNISGTLPYMSPEQYKGKPPKAQTDNWAVGVILYELLAGEHPFNGHDWASYKEIVCNEWPERIAGLSDGQWQKLLQLLAKEREQRPEKLVDFLKSMTEPEPKVEPKVEAKVASGGQPKTYTEPKTGMEFIWVEGGRFQMGSKSGSSDEEPVHWVKVAGFYMAKYPITQGQWKALMDGANPSHFKKGDDYPVENISWDDVTKIYLSKLNKEGDDCPVENISWDYVTKIYLSKLNQLGNGTYRLPTEAEWEYAARSGGKAETYAGSENLDKVGWYDGNSGGSTHPVGKKQPNGLGLYDMSGNVWEWCLDWYDSYPSSPEVNPLDNPRGPDSGSYRVRRGGSWGSSAKYCRTAHRHVCTPDDRYYNLGFRLVRRP